MRKTQRDGGELLPFYTHGDEKVSLKRFCINGVNKPSFNGGRNSQYELTQCHGNRTADPDSQDLKYNCD